MAEALRSGLKNDPSIAYLLVDPSAHENSRYAYHPTGAKSAFEAINYSRLEKDATSPAFVLLFKNGTAKTIARSVALPTSDRLNTLKSAFNLNLSQLAKVLGVSRPQLYKWLEGEVEPNKDSSNQKIEILQALLNTIPNSHCNYFGKFAKRYITQDMTVLDALSNSEASFESLYALYESIRGDIESLEQRSNPSGS